MRRPASSRERIDSGRRALLRGAAAGALTLGPLGTACARALESRSLAFLHTHTGESLSCVYFQDGGYHAPTLERVNHFLRDFRTGEVHAIDPGVLDILFAVQARSGCEGPFQVISGYRSARTNAELRSRSHGVAEHSMHIEGRAIDVRLSDFPTARLHAIALGLQRGGVGFYPASDFVHLDTGRVRFW